MTTFILIMGNIYTKTTFNIGEMSCSQLLLQIMSSQENKWQTEDNLSTYMMDAPIHSFTGLLTAPDYFEV